MPARITSAAGYRIKAPLTRGYQLSFATLHAFDMVIVMVGDDEGRVGFGESCPIPPYSDESVDEVWSTVARVLPAMIGRDIESCFETLAADAEGPASYAYVAPATAVEALVDPPYVDEPLAPAIVGTVLSHQPEELPGEVRRLVDLGYRTLKFKVGFDAAADAAQVAIVQDNLPDGVSLRLDANEGFDFPAALTFLDKLDPAGIELLEQPFPRDRWDWFTAIADNRGPVPLMLDESIHNESDIERAAEAGADIVKLKLMKVGTRRTLRGRLALAQRLGLSVVIGNGVAGVTDNFHESLCARYTERPGEMNGCLKLAAPIFAERPELSAGTLRFPAGFRLTASADDLAAACQEMLVVP